MCNYFKIRSLVNKKSFKGCFVSIFSSGGHLVHPSGTVRAMVEGHPRNIPVKLFQNISTG